jgi:hypothetical protein
MERKDSFRVGRGTKEVIMLAVFATLAFLVAMWLCVTVVADTLEQSGYKIIAALKGRLSLELASVAPIAGRVSQRYPSPRRPLRGQIELRAAA